MTIVTAMTFDDLVKARHSAVNFVKEAKMTEDDFKRIFDLTKLAPSAYNLQMTNYLVVMDEEKKEKVRELSYNQYKIHTASGIIIVLGNKNSIEREAVENIYRPLHQLKIMDDVDYETTLATIEQFGQSLKENPHALDIEITRNTGIHAMLFMMSAKSLGFDTCPMHVHNVDALREEFNIPAHLEPIMMIAVGKSVDKVRPRGYRKPVNEFVQFNTF